MIQFDSDRKRMTVIIKNNKDSKTYIFTKGSDGVMLQRTPDHSPIITQYNYKN